MVAQSFIVAPSLPPTPLVQCLLQWPEVGPRDCLPRCVSAFVFCLFSAGRVYVVFVGCVVVSWERILIPFFFALWSVIVSFRRTLPAIASLNVLASGIVFVREATVEMIWPAFVFVPSLFWGFFPSFCCYHQRVDYFMIRVGCLVGSSLRGSYSPWSVTPIYWLSPMEQIFSVVVGRWVIS